ncbi:MAG TPA: hypothetical protein VHZ49_22580 [Methylomirabilota bacterium]|jgi:hypothetical protein|nr:hypothetical protein [Methylomirabilota bacterium]
MKGISLALALLGLISAVPAHADTFSFAWESTEWLRTFDSPTHSTISGPFTLTGSGSASFAELAGGGMSLRFDGGSGTLIATGDGTFNGPMTFRTAESGARTGLAVVTPSATGFTVAVHRAASGPDAGAAFFGKATIGKATMAATEPVTFVITAAALFAAASVARRLRRS